MKKNMKALGVIIALVLLLATIGCSGDNSAATQYPTYTALPTYTLVATYTPWVVTATSSPTPLYTATITSTPTITPTSTVTPTITATVDVLKLDKGPGMYLVGVDIAPGVWRSTPGISNDCYWKRATKTGDIIDNYFGASGGTIYISPTDFEIELHQECGTWTFLSNP